MTDDAFRLGQLRGYYWENSRSSLEWDQCVPERSGETWPCEPVRLYVEPDSHKRAESKMLSAEKAIGRLLGS